MNNQGQAESAPPLRLKRYKCHKEVQAARIDGISLNGELGFTGPTGAGPSFKQMSREWLDKHNPEVGGYYVVYADDYESFSPAEAFESGYTLID